MDDLRASSLSQYSSAPALNGPACSRLLNDVKDFESLAPPLLVEGALRLRLGDDFEFFAAFLDAACFLSLDLCLPCFRDDDLQRLDLPPDALIGWISESETSVLQCFVAEKFEYNDKLGRLSLFSLRLP